MAEALEKNTTLAQLNFISLTSGNRGAIAMAKALAVNKTLKELTYYSLQWNCFSHLQQLSFTFIVCVSTIHSGPRHARGDPSVCRGDEAEHDHPESVCPWVERHGDRQAPESQRPPCHAAVTTTPHQCTALFPHFNHPPSHPIRPQTNSSSSSQIDDIAVARGRGVLAARPVLLLCELLGGGAQLEAEELVLDVRGGLEAAEPEHGLAPGDRAPHHTTLPRSDPLAHSRTAVTVSTHRTVFFSKSNNTRSVRKHEGARGRGKERMTTDFFTGLTMSLRVMGQMTFTLLGITTMPSSPTASFSFPCIGTQQKRKNQ